jgi:Do/DeqQ family serine protease
MPTRRLVLLILGTALVAGFIGGLAVSTRSGVVTEASTQASAPPAARTLAVPSALPDLSAVAERAVLAAANISSKQTVRAPNSPFAQDPLFQYFFGGQDPFGYSLRQAQSLGSGVIVSEDGYVLTNNHVVGDKNAQITVTLPDNRELPAQIVGVDPMTDLAVVKVDARGLQPLPWGDSTKIRMAEWVLAVGNPFGALSHTVTFGIISALGRTSPDLSNYTDFIQTDAAINPGNSGGALINARGELIGINSAIYTETGGYQGVGFAIPANLARRIMAELIDKGEIQWGAIDGIVEIEPMTTEVARQLEVSQTKGVIITRMYQNSDAYRAGLQPGDVIVAFDGKPIEQVTQLTRLVADARVGARPKLTVVRRDSRLTIEVPIVAAQAPRRRR